MVPRGEVEILIAGMALTAGAFDRDLYAVVVAMVVATALLVPPLMAPLLRRAEPDLGAGSGRPLADEGPSDRSMAIATPGYTPPGVISTTAFVQWRRGRRLAAERVEGLWARSTR